ncbi:hypothetical protein ACLESD_15620 [Pyxidicoccus sp. 3LFB2]
MHPFSKAGFVIPWAVSVMACTGSRGPVAPHEPVAQACTLIGCDSRVTLETKVDASLDTLKSSTLTGCLNDACLSIPLGGSPPEEARVPEQPVLTAAFDAHPAGGVLLTASYVPGSNAGLKDGDTYSFTVETPQGVKLVDVRRAVTYQVSQPNGPQCPPTCLTATLK